MTPLPLKVRLRAWWEGYDLGELGRILSRRAAEPEPVAAEPLPRREPVLRPARTAQSGPREAAGWTPSAIAAGQIVWGENSVSPRGEAQLKVLSTRVGLGPRSRILHLGGELGGTAAALERGLGCKVVAADTLPALAGTNTERVVLLAADSAPMLPNADFILVDGLAERAEPLSTILRTQSAGLAAGGVLLLRALVLIDERAATSARFRAWAEVEPVRPRLRSTDELSRIMQEARLTVTASSSASDDYANDVESSWGAALDRIRALHRDPVGRTLISTLLTEGERWLKRIELIREGVLGVRHFTAIRRVSSRR